MTPSTKLTRLKRPTLQTIADHLGITKMTISRYLRNPATVAADTGARIAAAIEQFGYIPNKAPEMLSNAKSRAIGVLVPSLTNAVFADVIRGVETVADRAGYQVMLAHYGYSSLKEQQRIESLLAYNVDGLILSENYHSERTLKMLEVAHIPVVEMMDINADGQQPQVGFNNVAASQTMTETMVARGYAKIVYLAARMDKRTLLKMQGYQQAMLRAGLFPHFISTEEASSFTLGAQLLHRALTQYPDLNGIFCTNDDLAIGALFECQRLGIKVPGQIAIAGFHGHDVGQSITPRLASVITPRFEIGKTATHRLIQRLQNNAADSTDIDLGYTISLGETL